jgi:serine/threonine protein phosphatase PrpC
MVQVAVIDRDQDRVFRLKVPDVNALVALAGPPLRPLRDLPEERFPFVSRTAADLGAEPHTGGKPGVFGGASAQTMTKVATVSGTKVAVACFTTRGPTMAAQGMEYKPYNEDGVVIHARPPSENGMEVAAIGAFDQAGGEGQVEGRPGAASGIAGEAFAEAVTRVEEGEEPAQALRDAVAKAGSQVHALGVGAVTTFAGAIVVASPQGLTATVAVVGDSRVFRVDKAGKVLAATDQHNFGRAVAAGLVDDVPPPMALRFAGVLMRSVGAEPTEPDIYTWQLEPGDKLVAETDGLADARELEEMPDGEWHADRCAADQARVVARATGATGAASALVGYALDQMAEGYGKPDNIGVAVLEVL